jgi:hypothetical protein
MTQASSASWRPAAWMTWYPRWETVDPAMPKRIENRRNLEDRVTPGKQVRCRAARCGQRGHRHGRVKHVAAHGPSRSRAARTTATASSIVTVDPLDLARPSARLTISAMLGRSASLVNSPSR